MKAVRIYNHGSSDVLKYDNLDEPTCNPDNLKIKIKASALNHLDIWVRNGIPGLNIPLPLTMGSDGSGEILEVGKNINQFKIGDKIVVQPGTFPHDCNSVLDGKENYSQKYGILGETENGIQSEFVVLNAKNIHLMPEHLSFEEAASMQLVFMTSYQMLVKRAKLKENEFVLIYGATSGVGSAAIQIARDINAKIITTVGNKDKFNYAYNMGADYVLDHTKPYTSLIKDITKNRGVDVVFEHIGPITWDNSLKVLNKGGRLVTCGSTTGATVSIDLRHLFSKQQTILGSTMADIDSFNSIMSKINNKIYKPFIDEIFSFKDARIAHAYLEDRKQYGKIILVP
jgi:NADPH:quinone reductase-like Zn-dependent oxidoreductase